MQANNARLVISCALLLLVLAGGAAGAEGNAVPADPSLARADSAGNLWYDAAILGVEGRGWDDTESYYDRLPSRARGLVRDEVWGLSRHSAGMLLRFRTAADSILVAWDGGEGMNHFAASGVSGLDLYRRMEDGSWRFIAVGRPEEGRTVRMLTRNRSGESRDYLLHLPLYHQVTKLEIGIPAGDQCYLLPPPPGKPIVFYGTSITQGGCASRPGMAYTNLLGRWLERGTINLGFSGNGRMEPEMARLLAELDPALYVLDCIPNVGAKIGELTGPFVRILREKRPQTPILLVEDARPADHPDNVALREAWRELVAGGDRAVYLLRGQRLLLDDGEATVDGVHPTDLGFVRMAEEMRPAISALLAPPR